MPRAASPRSRSPRRRARAENPLSTRRLLTPAGRQLFGEDAVAHTRTHAYLHRLLDLDQPDDRQPPTFPVTVDAAAALELPANHRLSRWDAQRLLHDRRLFAPTTTTTTTTT